jgi:hypothetical protein
MIRNRTLTSLSYPLRLLMAKIFSFIAIGFSHFHGFVFLSLKGIPNPDLIGEKLDCAIFRQQLAWFEAS